jgi:hypothetical protein
VSPLYTTLDNNSGQPDPAIYQERKEALEILIEEDKQGIIDLRYYDESGFCLVPYLDFIQLRRIAERFSEAFEQCARYFYQVGLLLGC